MQTPDDRDQSIRGFRGKYRFLSNFYPSPIRIYDPVLEEVVVYPTTEHLYQALKTTDPQQRRQVLEARTAGAAKRLGQKLTLHPDWEDQKLSAMTLAVRMKFKAGSEQAAQLLATGSATLHETNHWGDQFWGEDEQGVGQNHLGLILMEHRARLAGRT